MFLPVLFVRNWGILAWVVFAIPNIVGAAAMGFVIRSREISERILLQHQPAVAWFSLITIAFHIYFNYWFIGNRLMGPWALVIPVAAFFIFWTAGRRQPELDPKLSTIVWLLSLAAFIAFAAYDGFQPRLLPARWPTYELLWLIPVCIVGFALCPYLDATFHRALLANGPRAPMVFSLGFGLFFLIMILFTLYYTRPMAALIHPGNAGTVASTIVYLVGCHMSIQSAFTVSLHVRELERMTIAPRFRIALISTLFVAALLAAFVTKVDLHRFIGLDGGEAGYWLFMSFYSIFFPAYVWLFILPRAKPLILDRRTLLILIPLLLITATLFWIAMLHRQMWLLAPGLLILLLARLLPARKQSSSPVSAAQEIR
jgi:hypothetical protein